MDHFKNHYLMKYLHTYIYIFITACTIPLRTNAQDTLTLNNAIEQALQHNYSIRIYKEKLHQAEIQNSYASAGLLPRVGIAGSVSQPVVKTEDSQLFAPSSQHTVQATMPLFNGFSIITTKKQYELLHAMGEVELTIAIQNTVADVMAKYIEIIRTQRYIRMLTASLDIARERLELIEKRLQVGMANDADALQSKIDVATIEQTIAQQTTNLAQLESQLLFTIGKKNEFSCRVESDFAVGDLPPYDELSKKIQSSEAILLAQQTTEYSDLALSQINSHRLPSVQAFSSYSLQTFGNKAQHSPISVGISYSLPIYSGSVYKNQELIARSQKQISVIEQERKLQEIHSQLYALYAAYENATLLMQQQLEVYNYAFDLLHIIMKRFEAQAATVVDVKTAQQSFEQAGYTLTQLQYTAKISEIEIQRLLCILPLTN